MDRDYGSYNQRSMDSYGNQSYSVDEMGDSNFSRFGPYESYDSRSSVGGRDLYRSGYGYNDHEQGHFGDSYDGRYENPYRNSVDSFEGRSQGGSSWDPSFTRSKVRTGFMEDRGRDSYSSYGSFSSPYMKPAAVGSRGRGMPAYPENAFGGRSNDAFGGPSKGRGRGRGQMSEYGRMRRPGLVVEYKHLGAAVRGVARGVKRKMAPPFKPVGAFGKKQKLSKPGTNQNKSVPPPAEKLSEEEEEKRRTEARREKQRRRREKNSEKYGDGYRMAFTCSFCKFRSFDEKGIEEHLTSTTHQEMLDHIQKQTKFDKPVMEFLHECIVNKFKKTAARRAQSLSNEAAKALEKDVMEGVTPDDHMMKVETVHCSACSVYVPALHSSVQLHLKSTDHSKSKLAYKEQIKRESILTATSILNNPLVKARYELYLKGENPFENQSEEQQQEQEEEEEEEEQQEQVAVSEQEPSEEQPAAAAAAEPEGDDFTCDPLTTTDEV
ncbi:DBIRD complex subunit ZNF326 isoform X1 [Xenopus laevis]|uniref:DBIRD complex subunit ZNF326 n=1 Tax=Xenopus laevis TaxID=8355 RepID=A0A8J0V2I4_XENLA|nr:DBIRD complex subunit ZNF326 isoform X1 [Xenopus laevis]